MKDESGSIIPECLEDFTEIYKNEPYLGQVKSKDYYNRLKKKNRLRILN